MNYNNISPYSRILGIDTETSHVDFWKGGILEIGAIVIDKLGNEIEVFNEYCNPGEVEYSEEAMNINKIPLETIKSARPIKEVLIDFVKFMNKYIDDRNEKVVCVGNNFGFDAAFFQYAFDKHVPQFHSKTKWFFRRMDDLKGVSRMTFPGTEHMSQTKLGELLNIPNDNAHSALGDVKQMLNIYRTCMRLNYLRIVSYNNES